MKTKIENLIREALKSLDIQAETISLEHPSDLKMGDYSTNVAMAHAKTLKMNPKELAQKIVDEMSKGPFDMVDKIEVAGPGFINFYLSREFFTDSVKSILNTGEDWGKNELYAGKRVILDYTDPNPFKPFHIGHLMTNAIGESIARIFEFSGAETIRSNYQGDVGPHVAKAIYGIMQDGMREGTASEVAKYIGDCYAKGSGAYETSEQAKEAINTINKKVYDRSDEEVNKIYDWGRKITLEAFEDIYKILGTKFVHYFFESEMAPIGMKIVNENTPKIFEESEGAVVFKGEKYDPKLHTRVFITSAGIPLYETKELGLTVTKFEKARPDLSLVVTAVEQGDYMRVVAKAISLIYPEYGSKMKHVTHGMMRFASGKMSSRKGNVITGESMIHDSIDTVLEKMNDRELGDEEKRKISEIVGVAGIKYSILRSSLGSDIIYDQEKSTSFEGDSGPYLQYTAVRANSILEKARIVNIAADYTNAPSDVTDLEKKLYQFPEVVVHAYTELEPHHIATYLTELASQFNSFYANTVVLDEASEYSSYRVALVSAFYQTMKNGLYLLGIQTPEKM
ncbi:MAG: arginine--tRNA ligase [bacterium]